MYVKKIPKTTKRFAEKLKKKKIVVISFYVWIKDDLTFRPQTTYIAVLSPLINYYLKGIMKWEIFFRKKLGNYT